MHGKTAHEFHNHFVRGEISAREIVQITLDNIERCNKNLNAFLNIFKKRSLQKADALDSKRLKKAKLGKLAGIPIAIKDNIHVKGEFTTCASKILENYRAPFNATVTQLFEDEDALLIGKTNMDEFAMGGSGTHSAFGNTHNPWDLRCTPGGSSSGSAAAVAARLCPIAMGSDTGGSIRQPAAYNGVTGYKPTYGRVSRYGLVAFGSSLDQIGPITQNVHDSALIMEVIGKHCLRDSTSINEKSFSYREVIEKPVKGLKIGIPWSFLTQLSQEAKTNFEASVKTLKDLGTEIVDIDIAILRHGIAVYYILASAEASTNLARFDGIRYGKRTSEAKNLEEVFELSRQEGFGWEVKNRILLGTYVLSASSQEAYYIKAQRVRTLIIQKLNEAFKHCDLIALPVSPSSAPHIGSYKNPIDEYFQDLYTVGANLAGCPGLSVPSGFTESGLPLGIQFMGPQRQDARVLNLGHAFQSATDHLKTPKGFGE